MSKVAVLKKDVKNEFSFDEVQIRTIKFIDLHFTGGGSDKVYHAAIQKNEGKGHLVSFAYGRRESALTYGSKTTSPVSWDNAEKIYGKLVAEKVGKGYAEEPGVSGNIFGTASALSVQSVTVPVKEPSGIVPQLCNECTEAEVEALIKDPSWGMQEKMDGHHKMTKSDGKTVIGINKKGQVVPLPPEIAAAASLTAVLDGEQIGNVLHVFGMLECAGMDFRDLPYIKVYRALEQLLKKHSSDALRLVPLATTTAEKMSLFKKIKAAGKEGVVFKRLAAPYSPGKPNSGGDHLKFKFWADVSVVVLGINTKRSVSIGVYSDDRVIPVGNVSVPVTHDIPAAGDVVDIKYLYAYRGGCLFQPQYRGKRDDVSPEECVMDRIKFKTV